jgi:L-amino acid N-acyltransferase
MRPQSGKEPPTVAPRRRGRASAIPGLSIREGREDDLEALLEIYNDAVVSSPATFDLEPKTLEQRRKWFEEHKREHPLIVVEAEGQVVGYATLSPFRDKPGYSRSVESSVYIHRDYRGRGVGTAAVRATIERAVELNYHTIIAGIVPPNEASFRLFRRLGFRHVGLFREVGFKFGRWQDVDFFQLHLKGEPMQSDGRPPARRRAASSAASPRLSSRARRSSPLRPASAP